MAAHSQRAAYLAHPNPSYAQRVSDLKTPARVLKENQDAVVAAISRDYTDRSGFETLFRPPHTGRTMTIMSWLIKLKG